MADPQRNRTQATTSTPWDDIDQRRRRHAAGERGGQDGSLGLACRSLRAVAWLALLGWTGLVVVAAVRGSMGAANGIQETTIAATSAAALIAGYAATRAITGILREAQGD